MFTSGNINCSHRLIPDLSYVCVLVGPLSTGPCYAIRNLFAWHQSYFQRRFVRISTLSTLNKLCGSFRGQCLKSRSLQQSSNLLKLSPETAISWHFGIDIKAKESARVLALLLVLLKLFKYPARFDPLYRTFTPLAVHLRLLFPRRVTQNTEDLKV